MAMGEDFLDEEFLDRMRESSIPLMANVERDPTVEWVKTTNFEPILDLGDAKFCGARLGDSVGKLSSLGPCDRFEPTIVHCIDVDRTVLQPPKRVYSISYLDIGVAVGLDTNLLIESIFVNFQPDPRDPGMGEFGGKVIWKGRAIDSAALKDEVSLVNLLGKPDRIDETPEREHPVRQLGREPYRRHLTYERSNAFWAIGVDEGGLTRGVFVSQPLVRKVGQSTNAENR